MPKAHLVVDPAYRIADVPPRLFGSFVEHLGRCVYTGIYEPGSSTADEEGMREDVLELVRESGVSVVRYPGGNFVSGYDWTDGIGPKSERPARLERAWHSVESNEFGLHEFMDWARKADVEPMYAVNLGTAGVQEASNLLEYANHPGGTYWSDLRRKNGAADPFGIKLWCLGNEMDGEWQIGHKTADEYGRIAAETAKAMRMIDPGIEFVACGSSNSSMATFGQWEATVLEHTYDEVDFISLHAYYQERDGDVGSFLASAVDMDRFISSIVSTADYVRAKKRRSKRINLSFDEWNVWYTDTGDTMSKEWETAPRLLENEYTVTDAVVVGDLLTTLLRHSDRVTVGCQAQLVNAIGLLRSEAGGPAWRQTVFHPFALTARHARGSVLQVAAEGPTYETAKFGDVPVLDSVATWDDEAGELVLFAVNRDAETPLALTADLRGFKDLQVVEHLAVHDADRHATNTAAQPDRVVPRKVDGSKVDGGQLGAQLPPLSWSIIRLA